MNKQAPLNTSYQTCFYSPRTILSLATFALVLLDSNFGLVLPKGAPEWFGPMRLGDIFLRIRRSTQSNGREIRSSNIKQKNITRIWTSWLRSPASALLPKWKTDQIHISTRLRGRPKIAVLESKDLRQVLSDDDRVRRLVVWGSCTGARRRMAAVSRRVWHAVFFSLETNDDDSCKVKRMFGIGLEENSTLHRIKGLGHKLIKWQS